MQCRANAKCGVDCSGTPHTGCGCIYVYPDEDHPAGECICECYDADVAAPVVKMTVGDNVRSIPIQRIKSNFKATSQRKLDICVNKLPAGAFAQILDKILPNRILVPARQANARITMRRTNTTISNVVKSSGFILRR